MTVAIGLVCKDGVLVASDSMGSDESTARRSQKVHTFGRSPIVWTASGSVYVMEEVTLALEKLDQSGSPAAPMAAFTQPDLNGLRHQLRVAINKSMLAAYGTALASQPLAPGQIHPNFVTNFVVLGYVNETPWFLEFAADGELNWHTEAKFYAIGSGGPFATVALGLMSHYMKDDLSLEDGKLLAYRTIDTTIEVSNRGVGPPVQIAICDKDGARILAEDEIKALATGVDRWKAIESESLNSLKGGESLAATVDVDELPSMEALAVGP